MNAHGFFPRTATIAALLAPLCVSIFQLHAAAAPPPGAVLRDAASVLSLPAERAALHLPVSMTGIVTAAEPDWRGQFFVQDETGGVFVENLGAPQPRPGDVIRIDGESHPGAFAPIITRPRWTKTGEAPLPRPAPADVEKLMAGSNDGLRIEIAGTVRTARHEENRLLLEIAIAGYRLQARVPVPASLSPESLIGARVRVRGTVASHYNAAVRHLTSAVIFAPDSGDFTILDPERADPFLQTPTPVNSVAQYHHDGDTGRRVRVRGALTCQRIGEDLFLQDESGGIRIQTTQRDAFAPGEIVEAFGFLEYENYLPFIRDAIVRPARDTASPAPRNPPAAMTIPLLRDNIRHGELVTLRGRVLDSATRPLPRLTPGAASPIPLALTTWLVQAGNDTFSIEYETHAQNARIPDIPDGAIIEAEGVCLATIDANGRLISTKLLLAAPSAMRVLERPSWLTPRRLLAGTAFLTAGLVILAIWLFSASRKNAAQQVLIKKLEQAQRELQEAHEAARKNSAQQFKAVLAERTRLARDLHDTLEQTLAGIGLQIDTAARLAPRDPHASSTHLQLARNWLAQSQTDLRRSIWDLRSRELEQFDLAAALRRSADHLAEHAGVACEFTAAGDMSGLPEITEENILRIGQEALTNIARHARAKNVSISLKSTPDSLRLRIKDDGAGFDTARIPNAADGHFGLTGMAERVKRLAGSFRVNSAPGQGTTIVVEIPVAGAAAGPANDAPPPIINKP